MYILYCIESNNKELNIEKYVHNSTYNVLESQPKQNIDY